MQETKSRTRDSSETWSAVRACAIRTSDRPVMCCTELSIKDSSRCKFGDDETAHFLRDSSSGVRSIEVHPPGNGGLEAVIRGLARLRRSGAVFLRNRMTRLGSLSLWLAGMADRSVAECGRGLQKFRSFDSTFDEFQHAVVYASSGSTRQRRVSALFG